MKSILIFGRTPPPIGGVTISVKNLINSLASKNITTKLFSWKILLDFKLYDIAHIHYHKRWKILIAIILGKTFCKKVILTYHGLDFYPDRSLLDKWILFLLDGIIVLNNSVYNICSNFSKSSVKLLPPIFKEGIIDEVKNKKVYFEKEKGCKYLLIYAFDKVYIEGKEVYGCSFILNILKQLPKNYILIFLDPKSGYQYDVENINENKIIYINHYVDFMQLVSAVDLYIRPTNFDGNSVATLEALSAGIPVLASDVIERNNGIHLYQNNNADQCIEKIKYLIESKKLNNDEYELTSVEEYINYCIKILGIKNA